MKKHQLKREEISAVELFLGAIKHRDVFNFWQIISCESWGVLKGYLLSSGYLTPDQLDGNIPGICKEQLTDMLDAIASNMGDDYIVHAGICNTPREVDILNCRILIIPKVKCDIKVLKQTTMLGRHIPLVREFAKYASSEAEGYSFMWKVDFSKMIGTWWYLGSN